MFELSPFFACFWLKKLPPVQYCDSGDAVRHHQHSFCALDQHQAPSPKETSHLHVTHTAGDMWKLNDRLILVNVRGNAFEGSIIFFSFIISLTSIVGDYHGRMIGGEKPCLDSSWLEVPEGCQGTCLLATSPPPEIEHVMCFESNLKEYGFKSFKIKKSRYHNYLIM